MNATQRKLAAKRTKEQAKRGEVFAALWQDKRYARIMANYERLLHAWNHADAYKSTPCGKLPSSVRRLAHLQHLTSRYGRLVQAHEDKALRAAGCVA